MFLPAGPAVTARKPTSAPSAPQEAPNRRRDDLECLRSALLGAIDDVRLNAGPEKQAQLGPLTKQLRDTLDALDKLPQAQRSALDELKNRRAARASGAEVPPRPDRKVDGGPRGGRAGGVGRPDPGPVAATRPRRRPSRSA